jgi:PEP-CTERM motif
MQYRFYSYFLALAVLVSLCSRTQAQIAITAVTGSLTTGSSTSTRTSAVANSGGNTNWGNAGSVVTENFTDTKLAVTQVIAGGQNWNMDSGGIFKLRRNTSATTPLRSLAWYMEASPRTGSISNYTYNLLGAYDSNMETLLGGNNLLVGTDNIFTNTGNATGNHNTIERVDVLFPGGITVDAALAFTFYDRGNPGGHDPLSIAAITSLGLVNGDPQAPTNYGTRMGITAASYGTANIASATLTGGGTYNLTRNYAILRNDNPSATDGAGNADYLSGYAQQGIGGVLIQSTNLASAGATIYGFSIFPSDVPSIVTGTALANWQNTTNYPMTSTESSGQGLDLVGASSVLVRAEVSGSGAVPEPSTIGLLPLGALAFFVKKRQRIA